MDAAFLYGLERGEPFRGGLAQSLIAVDHLYLAGRTLRAEDRCLDREDLPVEATLRPRFRRVLL